MKKQTVIIEITKLVILAALMVVVTINTTKTVWMIDRFNLFVDVVNARCNEGVRSVEYFEALDNIYNVYAAVYDKSFNLLTNRHPDIIPKRTVFFEPLQYPEIKIAIENSQQGIINTNFEVTYVSGKRKVYTTPVFYRWVDDALIIMATPFIPDTINIPNTYILIFLATAFLLFLSICVPLMVLYFSEKRGEKCLQK